MSGISWINASCITNNEKVVFWRHGSSNHAGIAKTCKLSLCLLPVTNHKPKRTMLIGESSCCCNQLSTQHWRNSLLWWHSSWKVQFDHQVVQKECSLELLKWSNKLSVGCYIKFFGASRVDRSQLMTFHLHLIWSDGWCCFLGVWHGIRFPEHWQDAGRQAGRRFLLTPMAFVLQLCRINQVCEYVIRGIFLFPLQLQASLLSLDSTMQPTAGRKDLSWSGSFPELTGTWNKAHN